MHDGGPSVQRPLGGTCDLRALPRQDGHRGDPREANLKGGSSRAPASELVTLGSPWRGVTRETQAPFGGLASAQ